MTEQNQHQEPDRLAQALASANYEPAIPAGQDTDDTPDDVRDLIEKLGLENNQYHCSLFEQADGGKAFIERRQSSYPTEEEILLGYGPGTYLRVLEWVSDGELRRHHDTIIISEKLRPKYEQHQEQLEIDAAKQQEERLTKYSERRALRAKVRGLPDRRETTDPVEYIKAVTGAFRELGLPAGSLAGGGGGIPWKEIATVAASLTPVLLEFARANRERADKMMMMMMGNNSETYGRMVELLQAQGGPSVNPMMNQFIETMLSNQMQKMINGPEENGEDEEKGGTMDKVMAILEQAMPVIGAMLQSGKQGTIQEKMARSFVQSDPSFQAAAQDPRQLQAIHNRLEQDFGGENARRIMASLLGRTAPQAQEPQDQEEPEADEHNQQAAQA